MTFAHVLGGPLDPLIELGLPLVIFIGLYFWSSRGAGGKQRREAQRRRAAGDANYYTALSTADLRALATQLDADPADEPARELRAGVASELKRRSGEVSP